MIATWSRRAALIVGLAALSLMAGCSSSTTASALVPKRIVSFGDNISDIGQQSGKKYTVNDGSVNTWVEELATSFSLTVTTSGSGGTAYGRGLARINSNTDVNGNTSALSVTQQIDAFLAKDSFKTDDLVFINGGSNDVVAEMNAVIAGKQTQAQALTNVKKAGTDLATQVMRLVNAGANNVVVLGTYNVGQTPWATAVAKGADLTDLSSKLNEAMLVPIVSQGKHVLYVDITYYLNLVSNPASAPLYGLSNVVDPVCTSIDAGVGIGVGSAKVNSLNCTADTLVSGAVLATYGFADQLNFTPAVNRQLGDYIYGRVRARW